MPAPPPAAPRGGWQFPRSAESVQTFQWKSRTPPGCGRSKSQSIARGMSSPPSRTGSVSMHQHGPRSRPLPTTGFALLLLLTLAAGEAHSATPRGAGFGRGNQPGTDVAVEQVYETSASPAPALPRSAPAADAARPSIIASTFDVTTGVQTLLLGSQLPDITDPVLINATTQGGYAGTPLIELNGTSAGAG